MTVHVTAPMLAAYNHFLAVGFTENGAAAPVGNGVQESGEFLVATMFRAHPDWSGGVAEPLKSGGFEEWLGERKTALIAFIGRAEMRLGVPKGSLLNDLGTQCDFVVYELQTNQEYATLYQQLTTGTRSIANLTANFCWIYERPKAATANVENRIAHAEAVVARARLLKAPQAPQPAQPPPIPPVPAPPAPSPVQPRSQAPAGPPPISPSDAGMDAAILDNIGMWADELRKQQAAIERRIAALETAAAEFGKPPEGAPALPPPLQSPANPAPNRQGTSLMRETKSAIASTGVWGSLIAMGIPIVSMVADSMGHSVDPKLQAAGSILGGLLALYGRISATSQITGIVKS